MRQSLASIFALLLTAAIALGLDPQTRLESDELITFVPDVRRIVFRLVEAQPWREGLLERGLPVHLVNHLATMADVHRAGRYDRMSDDVLTLTGQGPLSVQEFVRKNAATFTASEKENSTKWKHERREAG